MMALLLLHVRDSLVTRANSSHINAHHLRYNLLLSRLLIFHAITCILSIWKFRTLSNSLSGVTLLKTTLNGVSWNSVMMLI